MDSLKRTAIFNWHKDHGEVINFSGWAMPIRIDTINAEHLAVRNNVGIFDVSHMGRFKLRGNKVISFLNIIVVRELETVKTFQAAYTFVLNDSGGFMDDIILVKVTSTEWLLICNASNKEKLWSWLNVQKMEWGIEIEDITTNTCMIAIQGPKAREVLSKFTNKVLPGKYKSGWINLFGKDVLFLGTGYTGEDGGEIIFFGNENTIEQNSLHLWETLIDCGIKPCGLGARDTLRLEAGFPLYGNELTENIHLLESGLGVVPFAHIKKTSDYIGKQAVLNKFGKVKRSRIFFELLQKGVARKGYKIYNNGVEIGIVTSGTVSPLTKKFIGMGYVSIKHSSTGSIFEIKIHRRMLKAKVIIPPAFDKLLYGSIRK